MNAEHTTHYPVDRASLAILFVLRLIVWLSLAYWGLQFVITLWRWALGFETY